MKQEEFLLRVQAVESEAEALEVTALIYPDSADSSEVFYRASAIKNMDWQSFYAVREMEEKFHIGAFSSAYIAVVLSFPKISYYYSQIAPYTNQEKGDFCGRVLDMTVTKLIPEWDKEKNDNFFAYMMPNLLTVRNAMRAEDGGPSSYLKAQKGMSLVSIEGMKEKSDASANWDTPDMDKNTEEEVIQRLKQGKMFLFHKVVGLSNEDALPTEDNIWNTILCRKLFHGKDEDELSMLEDPDIIGALEEYFDKGAEGRAVRTFDAEEELEAQVCLA